MMVVVLVVVGSLEVGKFEAVVVGTMVVLVGNLVAVEVGTFEVVVVEIVGLPKIDFIKCKFS